MAARRVLGAGAQAVRRRRRQVEELTPARDLQINMPNESPAAGVARQAGPAAGRPRLQVIRGEPTDAELAAVIAVIAILAAGSRARAAADSGPAVAAPSRSAWSMRSRLVTERLPPGPGGWRRSGLPR